MKNPLRIPRQAARRQAFTLVEVITSLVIGVLVLGAMASVVMVAGRTIQKNRLADEATFNVRKFQEHLSREISIAVLSTNYPVTNPYFPPSAANSDTPPRYSRLEYRVAIGPLATVANDALMSGNQIILTCPAELTPHVGDYLMLDSPNLSGNQWGGAQIAVVVDGRAPNTSGTVTLTLVDTIANLTTGTQSDVLQGLLVSIQRKRGYETKVPDPDPSGGRVVELHWLENAGDPASYTDPTKYVVLSRNVDAAVSYLFAPIPTPPNGTPGVLEPAVGWQFSYLAYTGSSYVLGGSGAYFLANQTSGLIMSRSGDPLNVVSYVTTSTSIPTSSVATTSTSTTSTTTTTGGGGVAIPGIGGGGGGGGGRGAGGGG